MKLKSIILLLAVLLVCSIGINVWYTFDHRASSVTSNTAANESGKQLWTCGMHPNVIMDHPGLCPICEMKLTPLKPGHSGDSTNSITVDPSIIQSIGVRTAEVTRGELSRSIRTNGIVMIDEQQTYTVNPKISGWIERLYVNETGQSVSKGQPLLEMYSPELVAAQEEYLLAKHAASTAINTGYAEVKRSSDGLLTAARDRLLNWDFGPSQIEQLEARGNAGRLTTLYSPATGIVMHKNAIEGGFTKASSDLFQIADLTKIWIEAEVYEYELPWVKAGQKAIVSLPYDPQGGFESEIAYIYPYLNPKTRTVKIRLTANNPEFSLKPDMYIEIQIDARTRTDAVTIPRESVLRSGTRDLVFLAKDGGKFEPREVKLGIEADNGLFEVISGLEGGEQIVTSAQFLLGSEFQLKEALDKLLAGGGSESDLHAAMGHAGHGSSDLKDDKQMTKPEAEDTQGKPASGTTMDVLYSAEHLYQCPMHSEIITAQAGTNCPRCNMKLVEMTDQQMQELRDSGPYGCVMCPVVVPGDKKDERCTICNMRLKPIEKN
jgi:Cu(I)/Ag(I) efflux system membrane fusion protein/cobalt-zinc-cadmium efflux system membrane fusion protein